MTVTHQVYLGGWFAGTSKAIGWLTNRTQNSTGKTTGTESLLLIDASRETVHESPITGDFGAVPSPAIPYAILRSGEGDDFDGIRFVGPDGVIGEPIPLPHYLSFTRWSPDGKVMWGSNGVPPNVKWYAVDPVARTVSEIPEPPKNAKGEVDYGVDTAPQPADIPFRLGSAKSSDSSVPSVWLESMDGKERILLSGEGEAVAVTSNVALYRMYGGALYGAPITDIGPVALKRLARAKARSEAMAVALLIGSAIRTNADIALHNKFPANAADFSRALQSDGDGPVVTAALKQFTYDPPLNQLSTKKGQPPIPIGFVANSFGRADVMSDGSAVWEDAR